MINRRRFAVQGAAEFTALAATMMPAGALAQSPARPPSPDVLKVGPTRRSKTIRQASLQARHGATIEVDAGDYIGDVANWEHDDLTLRAVGGRVRLLADGVTEGRKGIWVIRAKRMLVEGFDFEGATVPDRNGAGIRFERGSLTVRDCRFLRNQMGLLTNNDPDAELTVENCEFAYNLRQDGHNHNLYVGRIARLSVSSSYFHHAHAGHLLKTRAAWNLIQYNRLTDEAGGTASYELEFPDGGVAIVVGNIIAQSMETENRHLISYGAESYHWPRNALYLSHNTLINPLPWGGIYLRVTPGTTAITAINNLLMGLGDLGSTVHGDYRNNPHASATDFSSLATCDCGLRIRSTLTGSAIDAGSVDGIDLRPRFEYQHPRDKRSLTRPAHNPGAIQSQVL